VEARELLQLLAQSLHRRGGFLDRTAIGLVRVDVRGGLDKSLHGTDQRVLASPRRVFDGVVRVIGSPRVEWRGHDGGDADGIAGIPGMLGNSKRSAPRPVMTV